jgi:hypothetical protein
MEARKTAQLGREGEVVKSVVNLPSRLIKRNIPDFLLSATPADLIIIVSIYRQRG